MKIRKLKENTEKIRKIIRYPFIIKKKHRLTKFNSWITPYMKNHEKIASDYNK